MNADIVVLIIKLFIHCILFIVC